MYLRMALAEPIRVSEVGRDYLVVDEPFTVENSRAAVSFRVNGAQFTFEIRLKAGTYAAGDRVGILPTGQ
jgi:hypothetical protein